MIDLRAFKGFGSPVLQDWPRPQDSSAPPTSGSAQCRCPFLPPNTCHNFFPAWSLELAIVFISIRHMYRACLQVLAFVYGECECGKLSGRSHGMIHELSGGNSVLDWAPGHPTEGIAQSKLKFWNSPTTTNLHEPNDVLRKIPQWLCSSNTTGLVPGWRCAWSGADSPCSLRIIYRLHSPRVNMYVDQIGITDWVECRRNHTLTYRTASVLLDLSQE